MKLSAALKKQIAGEDHLPKINFHVTDSIVSLEDGRLLFCVKANGLPFEAISEGTLNNNYDSLNRTLLAIARTTGKRLALWTHLDHFQTDFAVDYQFKSNWMRGFSSRYMEKFNGKSIFENAFYLTFILKISDNDSLADGIRELEEIQTTIEQSFKAYEVERLTTYDHEGSKFSEVYEFFGYLYNGFWEKIPVTSIPLYQSIASASHHFGYSTLETRTPTKPRFSTLYDLKDFPTPTTRGKFNKVLELPFAFILAQSFCFVNAADSIKKIDAQTNKLRSAGDQAEHEIDELQNAKGYISSGEVYFGEYHGALMVFGATPKAAVDNGTMAKTTFSGSCATIWSQATLSAPETFYSMFPANTKRRPRPMPKTTRNLAGVFSMNTFSSGKQYGNSLGDGTAVMPLQTTSNGVYHFNFHYSIDGMDARGEKRAGHTTMIGATGAGKTVLQTTLVAHLDRWDNKLFAIDKDGSMRIFIEGMGGTYFTLASGEPTGLNPFQLPDTKFNRNFLYDLVGACGRDGQNDTTAEEVKLIKRAVDSVFELPFEHRRFGATLDSLPDTGDNCLRRRVEAWCHGDVEGRYAYALDNPKNNFDWETFWRVGFDVSEFLVAGHPATEPILSYLFHLKTLMQRDGGGLLATVVEEFWLPIMYPTTAAQILDTLKTGRRRDEFILLVTQSPEDAIKSPLLSAILQQTPTKIFLANPDAEYTNKEGGGYIRFGLTPKEFSKLQQLGLQDRKFLVKQGSQSSIAMLDLGGLGDDIAILAGAADDFPHLVAAQNEVGKNPDDWIPVYLRKRKEGKQKPKT